MIQLIQRYALAVFYFSTGGPNWKSKIYWLTGRHECGWQGVICSFVSNETANDDEVYFNNDDDYSNILDGDLELEDAKTITGLSIYGRDLQGAIPKEIGALEYLHVLDLGVSFPSLSINSGQLSLPNTDFTHSHNELSEQ
jgi:hypothetical protein